MLQSGMRAPMGVKVKGPDLESIEQAALDIERFLKEVPSVQASAVIADRIVGKPYLNIDFDRKKIARYGLNIQDVQDVVEVAIGGMPITTTVEGRKRFAVRVRYMRELRDEIEELGKILVPAKDGSHIPLSQVAEIKYVRGSAGHQKRRHVFDRLRAVRHEARRGGSQRRGRCASVISRKRATAASSSCRRA